MTETDIPSVQEPGSDRAAALRETLVSILLLEPADRAQRLKECLRRVPPEDTAEVLADLDEEEKLLVFRALEDAEDQAVVLEETDPQSRQEILEGATHDERVTILGEMPLDDLVDHLEALPEAEQELLLEELDLESEEVDEIRELRQYDPETAGGLMTSEFVAVQTTASSGAALAKIQGNLDTEIIQYVYVVELDGQLRGVVSIRDLLRAQPETPLAEHMETDLVVVRVDTPQEEVAQISDRYNLAVIPVVDAGGVLRGLVTYDDVMDVMQEEHSEDMFRMAGTTATHPFYEPIHVGVLKRIPFLLVTMTGGLCVLAVQDHFRGVMDQSAASAVRSIGLFSLVAPMLHLIAGVSGNVSIVTSTIFVRGYATGEITPTRVWRAIGREIAVGCLLSLILATLLGVVLSIFKSDVYGPQLILVCAGGLCVSIVWAAVIGSLVPAICRLTKAIDPAIASGPFVTITVDISASLIFLLFVSLFVSQS